MLGIEQDREAFGFLIELKAVESSPLGRNGVPVDFDTFDDPTKAHGLGIEQPGCVARLKHYWIHVSIFGLKHKADVRFTFTFRDDCRSDYLNHVRKDATGVAAAVPQIRRNPLSLCLVVLHVLSPTPVVSPAAIARMDAMLDVLDLAGFAKTQARRAYGVIHAYTVGFATLEASRGESAESDDDRVDDVMRELARLTTSAQSKVGLGLLIDGICADGGSRFGPSITGWG